jgi:hypothetical protein
MFRLWSVLVLALMMLMLFGMRVGAQTPDASPAGTPVPVTLDGLQEGVTRQYASDPAVVPAEDPDNFSVITVHIFRFDTADHAAAAWQSLRGSAVGQFQPARGDDAGAIDVSERELDDIGDKAYVAWLSASPQEGLTGYYRVLYVQEREFLYLLTAIAGSEEDTLQTDDLARSIVDLEPGTVAANFNADGTSTGALWDLLPDADDEIVQDLVPVQDREVTVP